MLEKEKKWIDQDARWDRWIKEWVDEKIPIGENPFRSSPEWFRMVIAEQLKEAPEWAFTARDLLRRSKIYDNKRPSLAAVRACFRQLDRMVEEGILRVRVDRDGDYRFKLEDGWRKRPEKSKG